MRKLTKEQYSEMVDKSMQGWTTKELAKYFNITPATVRLRLLECYKR